MAAKLIRVGLVFTHGLAYCRAVLRGIEAYAEARPHWVFAHVPPETRAIQKLAPLELDGMIAHAFTNALAEALVGLGKPLVNVSAVLPGSTPPRVGVDDVRCGALAADHLLDRGFRHFAFIGHRDHAYSVRRERGFRQAIEAAGHRLTCYYEPRGRAFDPIGRLWTLDENIHRWICSLAKPVGIFAPNDIWGEQLTEVCRQTNRRVPEDVAIIGVDNDDLFCRLARPSLSSIALPGGRIGYEAAVLLDRLLAGATPPRRPLLFPPLAVISRRSSDVVAVADPDVAAAICFIREQGHRPLTAKEVLRAVPLSRRSLERRFRRALGRTLLEEIHRDHVERARRLLAETDLPMPVVASRSGFSDARQLSVRFRQATGLTPTTYRRGFRRETTKWC
ncbi:MAG TPA: DNA-binding transcriptional regulator [Gemmataceae bacterium]|jgi:LacI family transcriptional regulator